MANLLSNHVNNFFDDDDKKCVTYGINVEWS